MRTALGLLVARLHEARRRRPLAGEAADRLDATLAVLAQDQEQAAAEAPDDGADQPLEQLALVFRLTPLDVDLLVVAAAPDLDPNTGVAYALLSFDEARRRPGVGLALELCGASLLSAQARSRLGPSAPLREHGLLEVLGEEPLLQRGLRAPDRVVAHLVGDATPDPVVAAMLLPVDPVDVPEVGDVARAVALEVPLVWLRTRPGSCALGLSVAALDVLGIDALVVDLARRPPDVTLATALSAALREAGLQRAGLVVASADLLAEPAHVGLLPLLERSPVPVLAVARRAWDAGWLHTLPFCTDAPPTPPALRERLWRRALGTDGQHDGDGWRELVALRLTPEDIRKTASYAGVLATAREEALGLAAVREATRRLTTDGGAGRAPGGPPTFDDLVLPEPTLDTLRELVAWVRDRDEVLGAGSLAGKGGKGRGIAALFSGGPGTGKTLAAHVVAGELGLDLRTVDLSSVVDKYIGETEKNLERVFDEAESLNVLLFFDEADALFGARSEVRDARDRYANQEVAYLLQRMEQFDGLCVLATNLRGNLDAAFARRLHFMVAFPDPDVATRRALWQAHLRAVARTDPDDPVDLDHLAEKVEVAGGDVRNVVLAAAYAAVAEGVPLGMRHVVRAVVREYRKLGRRLPVVGLRLPD